MNRRQKLVQKQFLNSEEKIIEQLGDIYDQSLKDVTDKIKHLEFKIGKLQEEYDWLDDKDPQKARIKSQIQSKIHQKQYQQQLQKQLDGILGQLRTNAYLTVSDYLDECYNDGFIGTIFDLHGQGIPIVAPIDQESMVRAVQLESKISKGLYTRLGEDVTDLKKRIAAQVTRGISTGMSFQQVSQQLAGNTRVGYNNAIRIARTEGHRIQTTAAMDAMHTAKDKGADVVKQWDATLDAQTRESHAMVDGEIRELDKPFSNGLDFPGDPSGGASEVINCRCAILQRAKWALDEDELETLKERAKYYGLDKSNEFDDFKKKYLKVADGQIDDSAPLITDSVRAYLHGMSEDQKVEFLGGEAGMRYLELNKAINEGTLDEHIDKYLEDVIAKKAEVARNAVDDSFVKRKALADAEKIRHSDVEILVAYDENGDEIYKVKGDKESVSHGEQFAFATLHNHPGHNASAFSGADIRSFASKGEQVMYMTSQTEMYSLVRTKGCDDYRIKPLATHVDFLEKSFQDGKISKEDLTREVDMYMQLHAHEYELVYTKIKLKNNN